MQVEGESVRSKVQDMVEVTNDILLHLSNPLLFASSFQKTMVASENQRNTALKHFEQEPELAEREE